MSLPAEHPFMSETNPAMVTVVTSDPAVTEYPLPYGFNICAPHDQNLPPACSVESPPDWCANAWCFVAKECSNEDVAASSYFARPDQED